MKEFNKVLAKLGNDGFSLVLFGAKASDSKAFCKISNKFQLYSRFLAKLGSGALAPPFCEAKAITSDEFCNMPSAIYCTK